MVSAAVQAKAKREQGQGAPTPQAPCCQPWVTVKASANSTKCLLEQRFKGSTVQRSHSASLRPSCCAPEHAAVMLTLALQGMQPEAHPTSSAGM